MTSPDDRPTLDLPAHPEDLEASGEEDALIGTTLQDTYKVVRFLAEGGMGRVYEAQHTRITTKRFAIKVLLAELKHSLDTRLRFRREAEAAASVNHPNVVGVHDFGYAPDGRPYLVSDFLEGRELGELLANKQPLALPLAISIAKQLCRGLAAAHDRGVIHRDLKPANVFLVGDVDEPDARVLDFGLARIVELTEAGVTQTGVVMGTPSYMSPEQAKGERADHRADIYGVGAVLYTCLTGRPPHEEETAQQTVLAVMSREAIRPCLIVPSLPPELEVVVQRALAIDPAERFQTMRDLEDALAPFMDAPAPRRLAASLPESSARPSLRVGPPDAEDVHGVRRRAAGWIALAVALFLVGGLSAVLGGFSLLWPGRAIQLSELLLVVVAVLGSLFTPALLVVRWLRKRYWGNSARMMQLVATVRGPLLAGVAVYGAAALSARVLDALHHHHLAKLPAPDASGWLGWSPFWYGLALLVAVAAHLRQRLLAAGRTALRGFLAGPLLVLTTSGLAGGLLFVGQQSAGAHRLIAIEAVPAPPLSPEPSARASTPPAAVSAPPAPPAPVASEGPLTPAQRADPAEIEVAERSGAPALGVLQTRYPRDPAVLLPLAIALGKEPQRGSELLRVLDALLVEEPKAAEDVRLEPLILTLALTSTTSQRAVDLMKDRMGLRGAEMLFDLVLARPEMRPRARAALETADVQRILSPALKIAFDLHISPSCDGRIDLLPQVIKDGDERAIGVLTIFTLPTKGGCGPRKNLPCQPTCWKQVPAFKSAIQQIKTRLARTKGRGP